MKKISRDGVLYEADQKIIDLLTDAEKSLKELTVDHNNAKIENVKLEAERDQLKEEIESFKTSQNDAAIEKAVQERMVIIDAARRAKVEIKADMKPDDIKKAVIVALYPKTAEKLDKCDKTYLDVRFDLALEKLDELGDQEEKNKLVLNGDSLSSDRQTKTDSNTAYQAMIERNKDAWKTGKEAN